MPFRFNPCNVCCDECPLCGDEVLGLDCPCTLTVTLADFIASDPEVCEDCLDLNGDFIVSRPFATHQAYSIGCVFGYTFPTAICDIKHLLVYVPQLQPTANTIIVDLTEADPSVVVVRWVKLYGNGNAVPCNDWNDTDIPGLIAGAYTVLHCNINGAPPSSVLLQNPTCALTSP